MARRLDLVPRDWRRARGILRTALAITALAAQVVSPESLMSVMTVIAGVFILYAILALLWHKVEELQASIAGLILETMYFVAFSVYGADRGGWVGSSLFLYLMLAGVLSYEIGDVVIVVAAPLAFFGFVRAPEDGSVQRVVMCAGLLACVLAYYKRTLLDQLGLAARRDKELRAEAEQVRDQERQRIAGDFHDGPLQSFIALQVRLDILGTLLKRDRAAAVEDLKDLQQVAKTQVAEIRSFLRSMKPVEMDASDLVASSRRIVEYFQKDTGISSRFICSESNLNVPPETSHEMLQILREALTNVQKHSKASRVVVSVEQTGRMVELSVDDDGNGFAFSGSFNLDELDLLRLGPQSIKRRVRSLGGEMQVESRPGHGAALSVRVPC